MQVWDRNAPLPLETDRLVDWPEARETVMSAYASFDPRLADLAEPFFTKGWIDAPVKPGKAPGAFAHPTVTDVHPYVMLNYLGKPRDVMTLAHELGHGVHQAAKQGEMLHTFNPCRNGSVWRNAYLQGCWKTLKTRTGEKSCYRQ